ncbi:cyclin-a2-4 [Anaeramoeba flamelloides]|uniref:Cyclin-a2-4 n=1 Tax=Anaeramoeba flamelloides TaxID=1746091 RepID=A0AAV7YTR2_9EUKA|nr:cyclin-a2-4 [Anaeramoeba flamelloides]
MFYRIKKSSNFYNKENEDPNENYQKKLPTNNHHQFLTKEKRVLRNISNFANLNRTKNEMNKTMNQNQNFNQKQSRPFFQKKTTEKNLDRSNNQNTRFKRKGQYETDSSSSSEESSLSDYESQTNSDHISEIESSLDEEIESDLGIGIESEEVSEEVSEPEPIINPQDESTKEKEEQKNEIESDQDQEQEQDQEQDQEQENKIDKILDINFRHKKDLLFVTEYSKEIYENYRARETRHLPSPTYLEDKQTNITSLQRKILVNWINDVCQELNLHSETYYLSINYLDRFLTRQKCPVEYLQLIAVTCIFIASKYEEIYSPEIEELSEYTKNLCKPNQILRSETLILNCLRFRFTVVTPKQFLRWYLRAASSSIKVMLIANYLLELQSLEYAFLNFKPSMIAASCVAAARWILNDQNNNNNNNKHWWDKTMEHYTGYIESELTECISFLIQAFKNAPNSQYNSSYEKYGDENLRQVSKLIIKGNFADQL